MHVVAEHSHRQGRKFIEREHPKELDEILAVIRDVDAERFKTKVSKEKTMRGRLLYAPKEMNKEFEGKLGELGWKKSRINMTTEIPEISATFKGYREMDGAKNGLGLEIQFGKYAFMVYNILAKMTIFAKAGKIDSGVEIVGMRDLTRDMSSGVSYFEQVKTDLEYRGVADLDIPVLVLGVDTVERARQENLVGPSS